MAAVLARRDDSARSTKAGTSPALRSHGTRGKQRGSQAEREAYDDCEVRHQQDCGNPVTKIGPST